MAERLITVNNLSIVQRNAKEKVYQPIKQYSHEFELNILFFVPLSRENERTVSDETSFLCFVQQVRYGGYGLVVTVIMFFGKEMAAVENPAFERFSRDSVCTTHGRMFI